MRCRHCGAQNPDNGDKCPSCDQPAFELNSEKEELLDFNPKGPFSLARLDSRNKFVWPKAKTTVTT